MRRTEEMAENVAEQIKDNVKKRSFFSIAIDESNDNTGRAHLAIFYRSVNDNFEVIEELLCLK